MTELLQALLELCLIFAAFLGIFICGAVLYLLAGLLGLVVEWVFYQVERLITWLFGWELKSMD